MKNKPLLFILRSKAEGGIPNIGDDDYFELKRITIESRLIDLIGIEFFSQADEAANIGRTGANRCLSHKRDFKDPVFSLWGYEVYCCLHFHP